MEPLETRIYALGDAEYMVRTLPEPDAAKPDLVMLHGFLGSGEVFLPLMGALRQACNPVLIDLPGHGGTRLPNDPRRFHAPAQLADLDGLIRLACKSAPFLYGYSMGGRLALRYALAAQDRLRGLILESTSPGIRGFGVLRERLSKDQERAVEILDDYPGFLKVWNRQPMFRGGTPRPEDSQRYESLQARQHPQGIANSLIGFGAALMPDVTGRLKSLTLSVQLIAGAYDAAYCAHARAMASRMPHAAMSIVGTAAHRVHLDAPASVADIVLHFLNTNTAQP